MQPVTRIVPGEPGVGMGWSRVARSVAEQIPATEIDRLWVFPALRREGLEWGTAVIGRSWEDRRMAVYTARYALVVRGKDRGQGKVEIAEVGVSELAVLEEVLRGVQERAGEADPPVEIPVSLWYEEDEDDEPAAES